MRRLKEDGNARLIKKGGTGANSKAIPQWKEYFHNPSSSQLGLATASIFFPAIITAFVGDWISSAYGRRWGIGLGASLIVSAVCCGQLRLT